MLKEITRVSARGEVSFYRIINNEKQLIKTRSNAILPNAKNIITRLLIGQNEYGLSNIRVFNGLTLLANGPISSKVFTDTGEAQFGAVFDGPSFNGTYTSVTLGTEDNGITGDFSIADGLNFTKGPSEMLLITWNIKIL